MNILVTGGAGYIGSHTCVELLENHHEVVVVDNFSNSSPKALDRVEALTNKKITCYEVDICRSELAQVFEAHQFDAVIHFAGLKAVGESTKEPLNYFEHNVHGSLNLLKLMKKYGVNTFIFSSSATVYGQAKVVPIDEESQLQPQSPYGQTKLMVEQICKDLSAAQDDFTAVMLRYFNPVGAHQSGMIGENPTGTPNNLLPFISQVAVGTHSELKVFGNDYNTVDGTGVRDYIHVVDLAQGHVKALETLHQSNQFTTLNLGSGKGYSVLEVVDAFSELNNVKVPTRFVARRQGDVEICYAACEKANKLLNWQTKLSLTDMVIDTWRWQTNNPQGY